MSAQILIEKHQVFLGLDGEHFLALRLIREINSTDVILTSNDYQFSSVECRMMLHGVLG